MVTLLCGLGAWPGSLRHWVLTCLVTLLLLPPPSNLGRLVTSHSDFPLCGHCTLCNACSEVCGKPSWPDNLKIHHWPWEVSVRIDNEHVCGGALIDFSWVISAAHCIQGATVGPAQLPQYFCEVMRWEQGRVGRCIQRRERLQGQDGSWEEAGAELCGETDGCQAGFCISRSNKDYSVMLGSSKLQPKGSSWVLEIRVGDIIVHPKYWGRKFFKNDIALLRLETPVTFNKYVQPICLPEYNFNLKFGTQCWVTGWNKTTQHSLDNLTLTPQFWEAEVLIIDDKRCDRVFHKKSFYPRVIPIIRRNMICTINYEVNLCNGDPGAPLACKIDRRWILAGMLSWVKDCMEPQDPDVYTRLTKYTRWIQEQVNHGALPGPCRASCLLFLFWLLQLPLGP
ncbi:hypothetical protein A6R68_08809 [Neotoma lepida]|uniref:Peptidase S1 domain-containing protein n=1 Tax=Neotoma lepida TaxID=56216 RepID=A0A1A6G2J8_NEOLE|nr:hypothetical protein A6R68_08809 [Neotoma lepida]